MKVTETQVLNALTEHGEKLLSYARATPECQQRLQNARSCRKELERNILEKFRQNDPPWCTSEEYRDALHEEHDAKYELDQVWKEVSSLFRPLPKRR